MLPRLLGGLEVTCTALLGATLVCAALCSSVAAQQGSPGEYAAGWLTASPSNHTVPAPGALTGGGVRRVELGGGCPAALLSLPSSYQASRPEPLLVVLHGAGGSPEGALDIGGLRQLADAAGVLLLAPKSRGGTWDLFEAGGVGPDAACIDAALKQVFPQLAVRVDRVGIAGFSDGASYALTLGLANGQLLSHVLAFSPGGIVDLPPRGKPDVFISHGSQDPILPIDQASRFLVPFLRQQGYDVEHVEFTGGHLVPGSVAQQGMDWLLQEP